MILLELKLNIIIKITVFIVGKACVFLPDKTWKDFLGSLTMALKVWFLQNFCHQKYVPSFMLNLLRRTKELRKKMSQKVRQHSLQITSFLIMNGQAKCTTLIKNRSSEEPIHGRIQPHCNNLSFEDEREFSYQSGSKNGPEHWGEIHEDWSICGKGKMQSPIDLSHDRVQVVHHLGRLRRTYRPANALMMNRGHDIMLKWEEEAGGVILNKTEYQIKQLHWHAPSEHSINGRRVAHGS